MSTKKVLSVLLGVVVAAGALQTIAQDGVKLSGDFRYRHEVKDKEGKDTYNRQRVRARIGLEGQVNEDVKIKVRLASGSDDPVSSNQTMDGAFTSKSIWLDRAYAEWKAVDGLKLMAGKVKNPFHNVGKGGLVWDGDLNPEGIAAKLAAEMEGVEPFVNAGHFWIDQDKGDDHLFLWGAQGGLVMALGEGASLTVGGSYFYYDELQGEGLLYDDDGFGNSTTEIIDEVDPVTGETLESHEVFANDYTLAEGFAELALDAGLPVSIYGDYVVNTEADDDDTAYLMGVKVGKAKAPGSVQFEYNYRNIEKDAVMATFNDSDFNGGESGADGHVVKGAVALMKNWTLGAAYLMAESDSGTEYNIFQGDLKFKFK